MELEITMYVLAFKDSCDETRLISQYADFYTLSDKSFYVSKANANKACKRLNKLLKSNSLPAFKRAEECIKKIDSNDEYYANESEEWKAAQHRKFADICSAEIKGVVVKPIKISMEAL